MKTTITDRERQILTCAFHILQDVDEKLWNEYFEDTKVDGTCKFYSACHVSARLTSELVRKMSKLFSKLKIYSK